MKKDKKQDTNIYSFFKTTLIGGFVVVLPLSIVIFIFKWIFGIFSSLIHPITSRIIANTKYYSEVVDLLVMLTVIFVCFFIGLFIKTKIGLWSFSILEKKLFSKIPGYKMVKETISQLFNTDRESAFASVALCRIFGNETLVTGFVTDRHANGSFTVFVPTGPNPTSGNIFHLKPEYVHLLDSSTEETMRSIISCGAGSQPLLKNFEELHPGDFEKLADGELQNDLSPQKEIEEKQLEIKKDPS